MFKKINLFVLLGVLTAAFVFAAPASASTGENDIACENWHHCANATPDPLDGIEGGGCWGVGTFCYFGQLDPLDGVESAGCYGGGYFFCFANDLAGKIWSSPTLAEPILNARVVIN